MNYSTEIKQERAILVAASLPGEKEHSEYSLAELRRLAETAGAEVVDELIQSRQMVDNAHYIGTGKLDDLHTKAAELDVQIIIFDDELTPSQMKNIQKRFDEIKILDRSGLILDIFRRHAKTRESKTQVELASLEYMLPRLTRQWTHLERQLGGIGVRGGPGETQIEIDRRLIRLRISKLKEELIKIGIQRETQRKFRSQHFNVALVGYTNAGKSTFMNVLTEAGVLVEDKLFATLDTTVRQLELDKQHMIYLSDTVGFIQKLPHQLVASFRSTLREAESADLLLKIIDVSDPDFRQHLMTIEAVLKEFEIPEKRFITVFNKTDLLSEETSVMTLRKEFPEAIFISALRSIGFEKLLELIRRRMDESSRVRILKLRHSNGKAQAILHQNGQILETIVEEEYSIYRVIIDDSLYGKLVKQFQAEDISGE